MIAQDVLKLLKQDARDYGFKMLNEAEHAHKIGAEELRFAATTAAATVEVFVQMIYKYERMLSNAS